MSSEFERKRDREMLKIIVKVLLVALVAWMAASYFNVVANNNLPGMAEGIWSNNFFTLVFGR